MNERNLCFLILVLSLFYRNDYDDRHTDAQIKQRQTHIGAVVVYLKIELGPRKFVVANK